MKKTKVLHIITRLDIGGSATNTIETVARLNKDSCDTFLVAGHTYDPDGAVAGFLKEKQVKPLFIKDLVREINPFKDLKAFLKLYKIIKQGKYDIVHTHSSKAGILGRWAAFLARTPYIVHTPHGHIFYGYYNAFISQIFVYIERITALITDKIITLTKKGKQEHIAYSIACPDKFVPIYSGINVFFFSSARVDVLQKKKELGIPQDKLVLGCVARLEPVKGNEFAIEAFAKISNKFPETVLVLVGDGELRQSLQQLTLKLGIAERVVFTGYKKEVAEILQTFDIFILSSLNEGMGRVILEAMACLKPVIASNVCGIPELVVENETGVLVPAGDSDALAKAMEELIINKDKRQSFGLKAKEIVSEIFSVEKMVKDIEDLYEGLTK